MTAHRPSPKHRQTTHWAKPVLGILALALMVALAATASALVKVDPHNLDQGAPSSRLSAEAGLDGGLQ